MPPTRPRGARATSTTSCGRECCTARSSSASTRTRASSVSTRRAPSGCPACGRCSLPGTLRSARSASCATTSRSSATRCGSFATRSPPSRPSMPRHATAEAVDLIEVEYEPLPAVFDPVEALKEGAPLVHETDARGRPRRSNRLTLTYRHDIGRPCARPAQRHATSLEASSRLRSSSSAAWAPPAASPRSTSMAT